MTLARRFDRETKTHGVLYDEAATVSVECNVHRPFVDSPEAPRAMHDETDAGAVECDATRVSIERLVRGTGHTVKRKFAEVECTLDDA